VERGQRTLGKGGKGKGAKGEVKDEDEEMKGFGSNKRDRVDE
jgi:hypothetical protein